MDYYPSYVLALLWVFWEPQHNNISFCADLVVAAEEISLEDLQTNEDIQPVVKSHISKGALTWKKMFQLMNDGVEIF